MIEKYLPVRGYELFQAWKAGKYLDIEFLAEIFRSIKQPEEQIRQDILTLIPLDKDFKPLLELVLRLGGDFYIASAGTDYYIKILFEYYKIENVTIISNPGYYKAGGIHLALNTNSDFYSKRYGVDKEKVVNSLRATHQTIFYAGDSGPDLKASLVADIRFAKGELIALLKDAGKEFYPFEDFSTVKNIIETFFADYR